MCAKIIEDTNQKSTERSNLHFNTKFCLGSFLIDIMSYINQNFSKSWNNITGNKIAICMSIIISQ